MSSPYPGNPSPQQPQGGAPQGGGLPSGGDQWGSPPPPPAPSGGYPGGSPAAGPGPTAGTPYPATGNAAPPQKKKPWPWIVGICGCLSLAALLAGGGGIALYTMSGDDDPTGRPTTSEEPTSEDPTTDDPASEEPTTEEPTTEEPTTEEPTTEEPTDEAGLPGSSGYEGTPVQDPTDADLDAAKDTVIGYLMGLSDNDPAAACALQLDPITGVGIDDSSILKDACVESTQQAIDEQELQGKAEHLTPDYFEANLDAEGRVILVHNIHADDSPPMKIAKGSDGKLYVVLA